jgi:hypothetical protein
VPRAAQELAHVQGAGNLDGGATALSASGKPDARAGVRDSGLHKLQAEREQIMTRRSELVYAPSELQARRSRLVDTLGMPHARAGARDEACVDEQAASSSSAAEARREREALRIDPGPLAEGALSRASLLELVRAFPPAPPSGGPAASAADANVLQAQQAVDGSVARLVNEMRHRPPRMQRSVGVPRAQGGRASPSSESPLQSPPQSPPPSPPRARSPQIASAAERERSVKSSLAIPLIRLRRPTRTSSASNIFCSNGTSDVASSSQVAPAGGAIGEDAQFLHSSRRGRPKSASSSQGDRRAADSAAGSEGGVEAWDAPVSASFSARGPRNSARAVSARVQPLSTLTTLRAAGAGQFPLPPALDAQHDEQAGGRMPMATVASRLQGDTASESDPARAPLQGSFLKRHAAPGLGAHGGEVRAKPNEPPDAQMRSTTLAEGSDRGLGANLGVPAAVSFSNRRLSLDGCSLDEETLTALGAKFSMYDLNNSGLIDDTELVALLFDLGFRLGRKRRRDIAAELDDDSDGLISFEELAR